MRIGRWRMDRGRIERGLRGRGKRGTSRIVLALVSMRMRRGYVSSPGKGGEREGVGRE
jgi:hypothetical protein